MSNTIPPPPLSHLISENGLTEFAVLSKSQNQLDQLRKKNLINPFIEFTIRKYPEFAICEQMVVMYFKQLTGINISQQIMKNKKSYGEQLEQRYKGFYNLFIDNTW